MSEIKRYDVILQCDGYLHEAIMEEDTDGDYVLSKDYDSLRAQLAEAQKEAYPAYKREKALRCKAENELAEAQKEIERRNSKTWCAYCGFEIDIDDEASTKISEHIMSCPKHPIRVYERHSEALEAENAALKARLKPVEEVWNNYNHGKGLYCDMQVICDLWQAIKAACEGEKLE